MSARRAQARRRGSPPRHDHRKTWLWVGAATAAAAAIVVLIVVATERLGGAPSATAPALAAAPDVQLSSTGDGGDVGGAAAVFSAATMSGGTFHLPAGKPAVLYFMAGWCSTCQPEAEALAQIDRQDHGRVAILAVDADPTDPLSSLQNFAHQVGDPGYAFAQDQAGKLVQAFGVSALDVTVVVDASGNIVYRNTMPIDEPTLQTALARAGLR